MDFTLHRFYKSNNFPRTLESLPFVLTLVIIGDGVRLSYIPRLAHAQKFRNGVTENEATGNET